MPSPGRTTPRTPGRTPGRTRALVALLGVLTLVVGGCSGEESAAPPGHSSPTAPAEPLWNPCTVLDADQVERLFGSETVEADGTPDAPACSFNPTEAGGVVLDSNYLLYPAGLDRAFETFGIVEGASTTVASPRVPAADGARLVVDLRDDALLISGFVQNGDLIQTVNLAEPAPFDRARAVSGMRQVLTALSRAADEAGLGEDP